MEMVLGKFIAKRENTQQGVKTSKIEIRHQGNN